MLATTVLALASTTVIHYAVLPKGDPAMQRAQMQPVVQYLQEQTGAQIDLEVTKDLTELMDGCISGKYDIAHMGGYSYAQVHERAGWTPLVQGVLAHAMHSVFITQTSSDIKNINDLKGKVFAFGDPNSAAEYLMPTYYLDLNNLPARATFKRVDTTTTPARDVANFKVDAAAMEEVNYQHALKSHEIAPDQVRVFYRTPAYPDNVWAARKDLPADLRQRWIKAFLKLSPKNPADKALLDLLRTPKFIVPRNEDYAKVRDAELLEGLLTRPRK